MPTNEEHELLKDIIREQIEISKDKSFPADFRVEIRTGLIEIRDMINRILVQYG